MPQMGQPSTKSIEKNPADTIFIEIKKFKMEIHQEFLYFLVVLGTFHYLVSILRYSTTCRSSDAFLPKNDVIFRHSFAFSTFKKAFDISDYTQIIKYRSLAIGSL